MRAALIAVFSVILLGMLAVTTYATLDRAIYRVGPELWADPWFHATLLDAYFGFLTFYVWVVYKERSMASRLLWLVLVLTLGNIAMAVYVLIQVVRLRPGDGVPELLLNRRDLKAQRVPDSV